MVNHKDGKVRDGNSLSRGRSIEKVDDCMTNGMEKCPDTENVVEYHFMIKNII